MYNKQYKLQSKMQLRMQYVMQYKYGSKKRRIQNLYMYCINFYFVRLCVLHSVLQSVQTFSQCNKSTMTPGMCRVRYQSSTIIRFATVTTPRHKIAICVQTIKVLMTLPLSPADRKEVL